MNLRTHKRNLISRQFNTVMMFSMINRFNVQAVAKPVDLLELFPNLAPLVHPVDDFDFGRSVAKRAQLAELVEMDPGVRVSVAKKATGEIVATDLTVGEADEMIQKAKRAKKAALVIV